MSNTKKRVVKLGDFLKQSEILGNDDSPSKRITVKLNQEGVIQRKERDNHQVGATKYFRRMKGQFIYGKQNIFKGAFGLIPNELDGFYSSSDLPSFDIDESIIDPIFFIYKLSGIYLSTEKIAKGTGSKRVHQYDLFNLEIEIPESIEEQKRIAEILTNVDENISNIEEEIKQLDNIKTGLVFDFFKDLEENLNFDDCFQVSNDKSKQVLTKDYCSNGRHPIVDQGKSLITAYSNLESKLYKDIPVIVFGDHTLALKYIDFNFIVGADGTQIIKTKNGLDLRCYFYYLYYKLKNITSNGYSRHFKIIKEMKFAEIGIDNQNKIIKLLDNLDFFISNKNNELLKIKTIKLGLLNKLI